MPGIDMLPWPFILRISGVVLALFVLTWLFPRVLIILHSTYRERKERGARLIILTLEEARRATARIRWEKWN